MHISINVTHGQIRVGDGVFGLGDLFPAIADKWVTAINSCSHIDITPDGTMRGRAFDGSVLLIDGGAQLRAAIIAAPPVAAWLLAAPDRVAAMRKQRINAECTRRIFAVASDAAQKNIMAYATDLALQIAVGQTLTAQQTADIATAQAMRAWIGNTQAACRTLIATEANNYTADNLWPAVPAGVPELVARF